MDIGRKLKEARLASGMTQEQVAEKIGVSRQSISNWENEKNFPDIISVIHLSDVYGVSLDILLKGDDQMIKHLDESTNIIKSNKKLLTALALNFLVILLFIIFNSPISESKTLLFVMFTIIFLNSGAIFYQLIKKI
ncbi:helix-turn-helix domain-containing protein [Vagococcus elongatus]|uniref:Transcriptional regulator n=1 Tax=Vagococcus elongatus TaxID=180344 RepID=A0A430B4A4_9ENTE|nr:helix-turn-helix transcriptional regulator [Vagococcus elongatus]RSU15138.1 transcriptional regulator [Vagococcus elongatus]